MAKKTVSLIAIPDDVLAHLTADESAALGASSAAEVAAYAAGFRFAQANTAAAQAIYDVLAHLSGRTDQASVDEYNALRTAWVGGYHRAHPDLAVGSGDRAWSRLVRGLIEDGIEDTGSEPLRFVKPQTPEQAKKAKAAADARAKAKADADRHTREAEAALLRQQVASTPKAGTSPEVPADGARVAKALMFELSSSEAHLIQMLRAGKTAEAVKFVASLTK